MASRDNPKNQLEKNWPKDFDVQVIITPFEHVAQRIYWYYATIMKPDTAKWYVRIDEDYVNCNFRLDWGVNKNN